MYWKNLDGGLSNAEFFWRNHYKFLEEKGYRLRPRYSPDWEPSWLESNKDRFDCEDGLPPLRVTTMQATRIADGRIVVLKQIWTKKTPTEVKITRFFCEERNASDPENHSAFVHDILQSPIYKVAFLVMPYLMRVHDIRFATVGEVMECFRQIFEGLFFIHRQHVAHCDIQLFNVMMDPMPLLSEVPHPVWKNRSYIDPERKLKRYIRTDHPVRYYIIDFGLSTKFSAGEPHIAPIVFGGDRSVPEYKDAPGDCDPFKVDIYHLGNMIREDFMQESHSLGFMQPLVDQMTREEPRDRPTIEQAMQQFEQLLGSLPQWRLRSRYVYRKDLLGRPFRAVRHVYRTMRWIVIRTPAVPTYKAPEGGPGYS
ncbi:kinase-like domain-containing protein [Cerioporus squamosus]|nr:kinase-like domain-containing protein [Cerioporus squamosus]